MKRIFLTLLTLSFSVAAVQAAQPAYIKGRIIVKYRSQAGAAAAEHYEKGGKFRDLSGADSLDRLHAKHRVSRAERVFKGGDAAQAKTKFSRRSRRIPKEAKTPELSNIYVVQLDPGADERAAAEDFRRDPNVEFAELDGIATVQLTPNDTYYNSTGSWGQAYPDLWGLKKVQSGSAWDLATGQGILAAVVDTGVDYNHPDVSSNMWVNPGEIPGNGLDDDGNGFADDVNGYDFVMTGKSADSNPADGHGHGTHVAGTIAAVGNNTLGVIGLAFKSKIMAVKGLSDNGSGSYSDLANALYYAANNGADVINNSWGGSGNSSLIENAVNYAHSLGAVVVAAAGNNNGDSQFFYPAGYANVVTVSAFDANDLKASFSNWGNKIDVAAPGVDILSLRASSTTLGSVVGTQYVRAGGTSMASPHVAGLAALILSQHPEYTNEQVRFLLRQSADDVGAPGFDIYAGYGRINALKALTLTPDVTPPSAVASVNDGTGADISQTNDSTRLSANWAPSADPESGISAYRYAIGTLPGMANIVAWTSNGTSLAVTKTGLSLTRGSTYYFTVKASNGIGMESAQVSSDGQWVNVPLSTGNAGYDYVLKAPVCGTLANSCDSGNLVNGRANIPGGLEPNQPNTINSSCADGTFGTYHSDESLDKLKVRTLDGSNFSAGKIVRIEAAVWAYSAFTSDHLDLYYAANASSPSWTHFTTLTPAQAGVQVLQVDYALPSSASGLQAVRGVFRYAGSPAACSAGAYDDRDDLVFAVAPGSTTADAVPPTISIIGPVNGVTISGLAVISGSAADDVALSKVEVAVDTGVFTLAFGLASWNAYINTLSLANGSHVLKARATDTSGNSSTASVTVNVFNVPPPAISSVTATILSSSSVSVAWGTDQPADSQVNYGLSTAYGSSTTLDASLVTSHSQILSNLAPSTTYHFRVRSKNAEGSLSFSPDFIFITPAPSDTVPPVISSVTASQVGISSAVVSWNTNEFSDSQVEYGLTAAYGSSTTLNPLLTQSHVQALAGLLPGTTYHFRVKSRDAYGNLAVSGDFAFATQAPPAPPAPNLVLNPSFESGSGSNASDWTEGSAHARASDRVHSGGFSLKSTYTGNATATTRSAAIPVIPNTSYAVSGWIYNTSTRGNIYFDLNNITGELTLNSTLKNQWQFLSGTWNSGTRTSVVLRCATERKPNGAVWFDDLRISPAPPSEASAAPALLLAQAAESAEAAVEGDILDDSENAAVPLPDASFGLRETFAYPNPASSDPAIRVSVGLADEVRFRVYDETGRKVEEAAMTEASILNNAYVYEHRVTGLASGTYLYMVEAVKDSQTIEFRSKFAIVK